MVSLAYEVVQRRLTHSPEAICLSIVICRCLGHVQRMDRICNTRNLERYIELNITIKNPYIATVVGDVNHMGTLGARVECIHYIPVVQR